MTCIVQKIYHIWYYQNLVPDQKSPASMENISGWGSTIICTFCECGENHVGMQMVGKIADPGQGFNLFDLQKASIWCTAHGVEFELWDLRPEGARQEDGGELPVAYLLIMKRCAATILGMPRYSRGGAIYQELKNLDWDKKNLNQYKKVVNKRARHNLVFADTSQEPDYEAGKGRVIDFANLEMLSVVRDKLPDILGPKAQDMIGEGNHYYEPGKTGIAWHGDTERRRVVGLRQGESMSLWFRWYHNRAIISEIMKFELHHDDIYVMSEWAVGTHWKSPTLYTLRHCAGSDIKGKEYQ